MSFNSSAQFGQDRFPWHLVPQGMSFVDIGCGDPVNLNNSYGLEQMGWRGLCVDCIPGCVESHKVRASRFVLGDSIRFPWSEEFQKTGFGPEVDYLSLDVDDLTEKTLRLLPFDLYRFRTMTIEHDAYRIGTAVRDTMRDFLGNLGYDLICADVCWNGGMPLEDWWVHPSFVHMDRANKIRCIGKEWSEIFKPLESCSAPS